MKQTNANFAETDKEFILRCKAGGIKPTRRQASKYRRDTGKARKITRTMINQYLINTYAEGDDK